MTDHNNMQVRCQWGNLELNYLTSQFTSSHYPNKQQWQTFGRTEHPYVAQNTTIKIKFILKCTIWSYVYCALYKNTRVFTPYITVYKTLYSSCRAMSSCLQANPLPLCRLGCEVILSCQLREGFISLAGWKGFTSPAGWEGFMSLAGWEGFMSPAGWEMASWVQLAERPERGCQVPSWLRSHQSCWLREVVRALLAEGA